jgi:hypothetical protein
VDFGAPLIIHFGLPLFSPPLTGGAGEGDKKVGYFTSLTPSLIYIFNPLPNPPLKGEGNKCVIPTFNKENNPQ